MTTIKQQIVDQVRAMGRPATRHEVVKIYEAITGNTHHNNLSSALSTCGLGARGRYFMPTYSYLLKGGCKNVDHLVKVGPNQYAANRR